MLSMEISMYSLLRINPLAAVTGTLQFSLQTIPALLHLIIAHQTNQPTTVGSVPFREGLGTSSRFVPVSLRNSLKNF